MNDEWPIPVDDIEDFAEEVVDAVLESGEVATAEHTHDAGDVVSGTLDESVGGTGNSSYAEGDLLYASAANTLSRRAKGNPNEVLTIVGNVPVWVPSAVTFLATNSHGGTIQAGQPVKIMSDGTVRLAQADDIGNKAVGLMVTTTTNGNQGYVIRTGKHKLADWTAALGSATLVPGQAYFLSPSTIGTFQDAVSPPDIEQYLGFAIAVDEMVVEVGQAHIYN